MRLPILLAANLTILFKAGQSGTAVPKAATMASLLLDNGCVPLFEELVAECASDAETLAALLRLLLAYGNDFRFRVACNREDETGLRDSLQVSTSKNHETVADLAGPDMPLVTVAAVGAGTAHAQPGGVEAGPVRYGQDLR